MANVRQSIASAEQKSPEFNENGSYEWLPSDEFVLNGDEFGKLYQCIKNEMFIPGGAPLKQKSDIWNMVQEILKTAVEAGIAKEIKLPQQIEEQIQN